MSPVTGILGSEFACAADVESEGAKNGHRAQGDDEGSYLALGDEEAVEKARDEGDRQRGGGGGEYAESRSQPARLEGHEGLGAGVQREDGAGASEGCHGTH